VKNEQIVECLLCGKSAELKHKEFPGYQEPHTFKIYHCKNCNTAFSLPRVETSLIYEKIYENRGKVPGYARYWEYAQNIKKSLNPLKYLSGIEDTYWAVKEALSFIVKDKKSTKILEIGSGLGYLTYSLIKANYDAVGIDISQTAVMNANENFGDHYICADLFQYAPLHPESFDIVILTEVIEHIDKPLDFIESIIKLLRPGGRVIISTPNKSLYPKDIIWDTEMPPVHIWWFSEDSMKYISKKKNTNITFINFSNYYKDKFRAIEIAQLYNGQVPKPLFNKNGDLIIQSTTKNKSIKSQIRFLLSQIPFVKYIYVKFKKLLNTNNIVCNERGIVLCAILEKL